MIPPLGVDLQIDDGVDELLPPVAVAIALGRMADRIALLNQGRIEQLGSGRELYEHPASHFVADFIGEMNFLRGVVERIAYFGEGMSVHLCVKGCEKPMVAKLRDNQAEMLGLTPGIALWIVWSASSSRGLRA